MSDALINTESGTAKPLVLARPEPRCPINVRLGTASDAAFIDSLQKMHSHMVGWFPRKQMESYIEAGDVLIAEAPGCDDKTEDDKAEDDRVTRCGGDKVTSQSGCGPANASSPAPSHPFSPSPSQSSTPSPPHPVTPSPPHPPAPLGYCIARDRYMGRDDVGIVYQLNVMPLKQRHLVGAMLVKATLERAAYGCRLFSCWCAQDIQANWFWESVGFVPLAFRTGSRGKQRIHIFWQRRVRESDEGVGGTPYWFPFQTHAGAVREDRLVIPIPADTHWRDVKPVILPDQEVKAEQADTPKTLPGGAPVRTRPESAPKVSTARKVAIVRSKSKHLQGLPPGKAAVVTAGGIRYVERGDYEPSPEAEEAKPKKKKRASKPRAKHDPKHIAQARELRDRYLEEVERGLLLPGSDCNARYDVSRQLAPASGEAASAEVVQDETRLLGDGVSG